MTIDDAIRSAAERNGVQQEFWDNFGHGHATSPDTNRAILTALGFDCASEDGLTASLERDETARWLRPLPPALVVSVSQPVQIPVRTLSTTDSFDFEIAYEDGRVEAFGADLEALEIADSREIEGVRRVERFVEVPDSLPLGYHEIRAGDCRMRLIVAPDAAHSLSSGRRAGLGVTLYGLRSARNWGCGDFRDLRDLIDWAIPALRVDFIALNPLHAIHNRRPYNASPYLPNSIFFRNFLYLDVEAVPGYQKIRAAFETPSTKAEMARLRATEVVEYEDVAALKIRALQAIFAAAPPPAACRNWIVAEGDLLRLYATYCALDEHLHAQNPDLWVWPDWPEAYRDPSSPAVRDFAALHDREILFHGWLQWLIDQQIAAVQRHAVASGMSIGLYHDLALATDRCGSDLWAHRPFFVNGARVGSPPDGFSPSGQDWSFPPPSQSRHLDDGYRLFTESIRKSMRRGGALRIDHVMRLFRLYWIPEGHTAAQGAYVRDRASDLVRILSLESVRNQAAIVGEDLGTVEDEVRQTLARFGILSYRLLIFEQKDSGFKGPDEYPSKALTSTTTHDLPTIAGFWTGRDIDARLRAGTIDQAACDAQRADRARDRQRLLNALALEELLPSDYERDAARIPELTPELHSAIIGFLASTPCEMWLINQEDLTLEPYQQNLPGTTAEYPNWSRKMRWSLEDLTALPEARRCAAMVRDWVERTGRVR